MFLFERTNSGSKHLIDLRESFQRVDLVQVVCVYELMRKRESFQRVELVQVVCVYELMFQIRTFMCELKPKTFSQAE